MRTFCSRTSTGAAEASSTWPGPRRFRWVPRASVARGARPCGIHREMERACARAAPQATTASECAAGGLHAPQSPQLVFEYCLRQMQSVPYRVESARPVVARRRVACVDACACTLGTTRVRVIRCTDACSSVRCLPTMITGRLPLVWSREQPHHHAKDFPPCIQRRRIGENSPETVQVCPRPAPVRRCLLKPSGQKRLR